MADTGSNWGFVLCAPLALPWLFSEGIVFISDVLITATGFVAACGMAYLGGTKTKNAPGNAGLLVSGLVITTLIVYGVFWVTFTFFYAQSHVQAGGHPSYAPYSPSPESEVEITLTSRIGLADYRKEVIQGNNLDLYVSLDSWQKVIQPDPSSIQRIGKAWCEGVKQTYFPAVRIRDVDGDRIFASYSCTFDRISAN